eukprot:scaffold123659_cov36-Tisochrysis_lutea.AAC.1
MSIDDHVRGSWRGTRPAHVQWSSSHSASRQWSAVLALPIAAARLPSPRRLAPQCINGTESASSHILAQIVQACSPKPI